MEINWFHKTKKQSFGNPKNGERCPAGLMKKEDYG